MAYEKKLKYLFRKGAKTITRKPHVQGLCQRILEWEDILSGFFLSSILMVFLKFIHL